ncbi:AAA family ATPase [Methylobacterium aerolatum]|uniref:AAA+ ATPase domain-containing protein n=1 Tax=Methylobacterium aerolatum TaxID=418708 RepID=A0ABU0I0K2_9HYPH|nr:AAA family ATPase [Methylobacterium aerolatum]MDQ0448116.1 hypothetical protein [Methylobacterium aerolatum]GJD34015.1 ATP-dependent zinc metalloprotease FtsH [Methylobacterium aerolatum]
MNSSKKSVARRIASLARAGRKTQPARQKETADPQGVPADDLTAAQQYLLDGDEDHSNVEPMSGALTSPNASLAKAMLAAALSGPAFRRMTTAPRLSVLIEAPSQSWVQPLRQAVAAAGTWDKVDARDVVSRPRLRADEGEAELVKLMATGSRIAVVSWLPERYVSRAFIDGADMRVRLGHPTNEVLRSVIRQATGRRPRRMPASVQGLDYPDYLAAIRVGDRAANCVARLEATARARMAPAANLEDVPLVCDLVGYGEAGSWALQVVASVEAWRRGEGIWPAGTLNACLASRPGLGKTTLLRSLGKSCGLPVVTTSVAGWFAGSGYLDDVLRRMQADLLRASASAPCILYFDEADALPSRSGGDDRHSSYWMPILGALLSFTDGLGLEGADASRIIIVAATNAPDRIDPAMLRPGRLGRVIRIAPPDAEALEGILRQHLGDDLANEDLSGVVSLGLGSTGAEARSWVESARLKARLDGRPMRVEDLVREVAPADARSDKAIWRCAAHEAGHAVCMHYADGHRVRRISIVSNGQAGGHTISTPVDGATMSPKDISAVLVGLLGGRAAEDALGLGLSSGAHHDLGEATSLAAAKTASFGMGGQLVRLAPMDRASGLLDRNEDLRLAVEVDLQAAYAEALGIVRQHQSLVEGLARLLVAQRVVDETTFYRLVEAHDRALAGAVQEGPRHG